MYLYTFFSGIKKYVAKDLQKSKSLQVNSLKTKVCWFFSNSSIIFYNYFLSIMQPLVFGSYKKTKRLCKTGSSHLALPDKEYVMFYFTSANWFFY